MTPSPADDFHTDDRLRVLFDPQIFCHQRFGGVSRYICSMSSELAQMGDMQPLITAAFHFNEHLAQSKSPLIRGRYRPKLERLSSAAYGLSTLAARLEAERFKPHILHRTYYFPTISPKGALSVLTVYDMIHEKFPEYFGRNPLTARLKKNSLATADHVICISESTRRDLLENTDIPAERVSVTHLGFDPMDSLLRAETPKDFRTRILGMDSPYILYVGSRALYKNFLGLLNAYASSIWLRENLLLLCFGGGDFTDAERTAISKLNVASRVKQAGGSDTALAACYSHASIYVCPSLYEGFGIPPLEAMSLGCPVACSNSSSLPEVVGDAAALFEPLELESIQQTLESTLNSPNTLADLITRGSKRKALFSWKNCAEETAQIYRNLSHR